MPELREVFEMTTRNIEPDLHEWDEQERRQRRFARNRKLGAISLSVVLAVAVALIVGNALDLTDQSKDMNKAAGKPAVLPSDPGVYLFDLETKQSTRVPGSRSFDAVSPDGSMVAYVGTDTEGRHLVYVANIDGTNVRALAKTATTASDDLGALTFSPDGRQIAYQVRPLGSVLSIYVGDLFLVDVATGETTRLTHLKQVESDLWFMALSFSPDGQTVFFTRPTGNQSWGLWSVAASGGRPRMVLRDAIGGRLSPDGRRIVYFEYNPSPENEFLGDMWLADADGTDARRLAVTGDVFSANWSPDGTKISYIDLERGIAYVVDVAAGEISSVLKDVDGWPEWVDDHTWIIGVE